MFNYCLIYLFNTAGVISCFLDYLTYVLINPAIFSIILVGICGIVCGVACFLYRLNKFYRLFTLSYLL